MHRFLFFFSVRPSHLNFDPMLFPILYFLAAAKGYLRPREYVVAEWPLRSTISDFWSLVYDHDVTSVVVLCNPLLAEASVRC